MVVMQDPRVTKCLAAKRESKAIEFKESFNPAELRQALEVLKDIVAIANSGGGALAIGITNNGEAAGTDVTAALDFDHAKYCDLVRKYTSTNYSDFEVVDAEKNGRAVAIFLINPPDSPLVFEKPGQYATDNNAKQATVFGQGTVFFRHGAKSETGTTDDLRQFVGTRIREVRETIIRGLKAVTVAPRGAELQVVGSRQHLATVSASGQAVRLTTDVNAPAAIAIDRHTICPYRQKDVLERLKIVLPLEVRLNSHDLQAINRVYEVADNQDFAWKPEFSARQYSDAYIDWIAEQVRTSESFLSLTRQKLYELNHPEALQFHNQSQARS